MHARGDSSASAARPFGRAENSRRSPVLLVQRKGDFVEGLQRLLSPLVPFRVVDSMAGAQLERGARLDWGAFVVDTNLLEGGLDLAVAEIRDRYPTSFVVITTAVVDANVINTAFSCGAFVLCTPPSAEALRRLAIGVLARASGWRADVTEVVAELSARCALTDAEAQIVASAASGFDRNATMAMRGISASTFRTHVSHLLRKTGAATLGDLRDGVLRRVSRCEQVDHTNLAAAWYGR